MRREHQRGRAVVVTIALLLLVGTAYVAFGPGVPFRHHYEFRAAFRTSNQLKSGSDVRIGGISVGTVKKVVAGPGDTVLATVRIDEPGVVIHSDAHLSIEPRLALEGNYFVKVSPGTPGAPAVRSGATIPLKQTAVPVQIDQVLDMLELPTRQALVGSVKELADGLGSAGGASPGGTGYDGLRQSIREFDRVLPSAQQTARALQGTRSGDLSSALGSTGDFTGQLVQRPEALAGLVSDFDKTFATLAAEHQAVSNSIQQADEVLRTAPAQLTSIDNALPSVTRLASVLRPVLTRAPVTLQSANRFLGQVGRLVRPSSLPRLLHSLRPATATLAPLENRLRALLPYLTTATRCVSNNVVPTLDTKLKDGPNTSSYPVWLDFMHLGASLSSVAANFDANGTTARVGINESENLLRGTIPGLGNVFVDGNIEGVAPTFLGNGVDPPYRPDEPCVDQALPNLNTRRSGPPSGFSPVPRSHVTRANANRAVLQRALASKSSLKVIRALLNVLGNTDRLTGSMRTQLERLLDGGGSPTTSRKPGRHTAPKHTKTSTPGASVSPPNGGVLRPLAPILKTVDGLLSGLKGRLGGDR